MALYEPRILDPMLFDLCDPSIHRSPVTSNANRRQVQYFEYDRTFDQRYIIHVLGILLSVVRFGGQGLTKVARATPISRSSHAALRERARSSMSCALLPLQRVLIFFSRRDCIRNHVHGRPRARITRVRLHTPFTTYTSNGRHLGIYNRNLSRDSPWR